MNLSFAGCGFLGIYHVGVASCFKEYAPQISVKTISGSSAGALVAIAHICGNTQLGFATTDNLKVAMDARQRTLGPFHPNFDLNAIVQEALDRGLPDDAHVRATGVLNVSLTRQSDGSNVIINEFASRDELIQALLCSCFIPFFSGFVAPKLRGIAYVDGGFSNNLLKLDEHTITVSPFCGEADICPLDDSFGALMQINFAGTSIAVSPANMHRICNALLPAPPEVLKQLCQQGFDDGMRYLQKNKLISCNRCLNIKSPAKLNVNVDEICELETLDSQRARFASHRRTVAAAAASRPYNGDQQQTDSDTDGDEFDDRTSLCSSSCDSDFSSMGATSVELYTDYDAEYYDDGDNCDDCRRRRQLALAETLPHLLMDKLRDACDSVNKSLYEWLYSHWPIKYLSYMTTPYTLPLDLTLAAFVRLWHAMPSFRRAFVACLNELINFLLDVVCSIEASSSSSTTGLLLRSAACTVKLSPLGRNISNSLLKAKLAQPVDDEAERKAAAKLQPDDDFGRTDEAAAAKTDAKAGDDAAKKVHPFYLLIDNSKLVAMKQGSAKPLVEISLADEEALVEDAQQVSSEDLKRLLAEQLAS